MSSSWPLSPLQYVTHGRVVLGVPYDPSLDIWSVGCTLYELYTGKILFPGRSNNQMLLLMMELKGRFNGKMIKKAKFGDMYFDDMGGFQSVETNKVLGTVRLHTFLVSRQPLLTNLLGHYPICTYHEAVTRFTRKAHARCGVEGERGREGDGGFLH